MALSSLFSRTILAAVIAITLAVLAPDTAEAQTTMEASYYGPSLEGNSTASGEPFYPYDDHYTAAHKTLPFGTWITVCYIGCASVEITDRGPYYVGRDLDLGYASAQRIGLIPVGTDFVTVYFW